MSLTDLRDVITYMEAAIRDRDQLMIDLDNAGKENHQLRNDLTACQLERDALRRLCGCPPDCQGPDNTSRVCRAESAPPQEDQP